MASEIQAVQVEAVDADTDEVAVGWQRDEIPEKLRRQPIEPLTPEAWREAILSTVTEIGQV